MSRRKKYDWEDRVNYLVADTERLLGAANRAIEKAIEPLKLLSCTCCGVCFISSIRHAFCFPCREEMDREDPIIGVNGEEW